MNVNKKQILALLAVFAVVAQGAVAAATLGLNTQASEYPETKFVEDELTIDTHNRSTMGWLQYEDDNGQIQTLDAHVNGTESGAQVGYRADQIAAEELGLFPRISGDDENNNTWLNAGDWTTSAAAVSVTDTDGSTGDEVDSVQITTDGSLTSGASEHTAYAEGSVESDAEKRYVQLVLNVENLEGDLEVQYRDADGDYVAAYANSTANASKDHVIANGTADGVIYQRQVGEFAVQGAGDGSMDAIEEIRFVVSDADVTATVTGLNAEKKSKWDFGTERVPDGDDAYTGETVYNRAAGGVIEAAELADLGGAFSDALINDLRYFDVEYRMQDDPDAVTIEFEDAGETYPSYESVLKVDFRQAIPTAYDIKHGAITLETEQSFLSERYVTLRYAEGVGDTETENISDDTWIDLSGSLGDKETTIVADDTVDADTEYAFQLEVKLTAGQVDNLQNVQESSGGFWGSSGGSPFHSLYNWVVGGIVGLLTTLGIAKSRS